MINKAAKSRFIENVVALCKVHNLSLAHEDSQGAFIVTKYDENNIAWLRGAMVKEDRNAGSPV